MGSCISSIRNKKKFSRTRKHFKQAKRSISKNSTDEKDDAGEAQIFPLHIPKNLETMMSFLDTDSLKTCRFVSAQWNNEALKILAKRWYISIDQQNWVKGLRSYWKDPKSTRCFCRNIANCQDPQYFFTNIKVPFFTIERNKKIREIIQKFGIHLKALHLGKFFEKTDEIRHYELIKEVLTCWCPNLTTLTIGIDTGHFPTPPNGHEFSPVNPLRNVTTLELDRVGCNDEDSQDSDEFALFLIKSCNKLNSLRNRAPFFVFQKLSEFPEITRNLQKFKWTDFNSCENLCACASLKSISSLKFSSKLKHIDLWMNITLSDPECCQSLYNFLRTLSTHLEFFKIGVKDYFPPTRSLTYEDTEVLRSYRPAIAWSQVEAFVPEMTKLKVLILDGNHAFGLDSFHFLRKCPNLVKLKLGHDGCGSICISNYPKKGLEDSQIDWVHTCPRVHLKELYIRGDWMQEAVFAALPKGFPNLTSLFINNYTVVLRHAIVKCVTKLEHLMDLALDIREWSSLDVLFMLPDFENCKALRILKIINSQAQEMYRICRQFEDKTCELFWHYLSPLKDMQCIFMFKKFPMTEKEENKLLSIAKKNGMHLKWESINTNKVSII